MDRGNRDCLARPPQSRRSSAQLSAFAKAYGSYEELLADPQIEAIYNPLPEPASCSLVDQGSGSRQACFVRETAQPDSGGSQNALGGARPHRGKDRRSFHGAHSSAVAAHPRAGRFGPDWRTCVQSSGFFSYFNRDATNIRNIPEYGGGALMDIGCYPINTSRFVFGEEPSRVSGVMEKDPEMKN